MLKLRSGIWNEIGQPHSFMVVTNKKKKKASIFNY